MWHITRSFYNLMKNPDFSAKSGPNLDHFPQKSPDQSPEMRTKVGALHLECRPLVPIKLRQLGYLNQAGLLSVYGKFQLLGMP